MCVCICFINVLFVFFCVLVAVKHLTVLGAIDPETQTITELGKSLALLPVSPRLAKMLVLGRQGGKENRNCTLSHTMLNYSNTQTHKHNTQLHTITQTHIHKNTNTYTKTLNRLFTVCDCFGSCANCSRSNVKTQTCTK